METAKTRPATILLVDDEPFNLKLLQTMLRAQGYETIATERGAEALALASQAQPQLILLDIMMPDMDGIEVLRQLKAHPDTRNIPIIMVTGLDDRKSRLQALEAGAEDFLGKPPDPAELLIRVRNLLQLKEYANLLAEHNLRLEEKVEQRTEQLKKAMQRLDLANESLKKQYIDSIRAFSRIIEMRPGIKSGQSKYIAETVLLVARELRMDSEEKKNIFYAGLLIQLGKMTLPDTLLSLPYYKIPLSDKQGFLKHAVEGEALLKGLPQLKGASVLIRHQYERYDGSGFPDGLAKQSIPLGSRILSVVRDYISYLEGSKTGVAMSVSAAISQLVTLKGSYYDPEIIDAFITVLKNTTPEQEVLVEPPEISKSWKNSKLFNGSQTLIVERPVIEISWTQLKVGMELESIYFENKPYLKNCIADQKIINNITSLRENTGKNPVIKIRMGATER